MNKIHIFTLYHFYLLVDNMDIKGFLNWTELIQNLLLIFALCSLVSDFSFSSSSSSSSHADCPWPFPLDTEATRDFFFKGN